MISHLFSLRFLIILCLLLYRNTSTTARLPAEYSESSYVLTCLVACTILLAKSGKKVSPKKNCVD